MFFLKALGFIFLLGLVVIVWILFAFFKRVNDAANQFGQGRNRRQNTRQRHTYGSQEGVVGQRNAANNKPKIIPKDEGEYIDFTEEK